MSGDLKFSVLAAAKVFEEAEWKYGRPRDHHIPDVEELAKKIDNLVRSVRDEGNAWARSGRFMVERDEEDGEITVYLELGQP